MNTNEHEEIRKAFPIYSEKPSLIYADSASSTQKPVSVIDAMNAFYRTEYANIHRGAYALSMQASQRCAKIRAHIAHFFSVQPNEIIFTKGTTEGINLLTHSITPLLKEGKDTILLTEMEHHSNLVPWQEFAKKHNLKLDFIPITSSYELDYEIAQQKLTENVLLVGMVHLSNALGTVNDSKRLITSAKEKDILTLVDGAQSAAHLPVNLAEIGCDFFVCSAHKMYGPTGVGMLYINKNYHDALLPFHYGGDMIQTVDYDKSTYAPSPAKFEAGTLPIVEIIGFGKAIEFIEELRTKGIEAYEQELFTFAYDTLSKLPGVKIYSPGKEKGKLILSFTVEGIHVHDLATFLDQDQICMRSGHHCTMPLMKKLGIAGTLRLSIGCYNTKEEITQIAEQLKKSIEALQG